MGDTIHYDVRTENFKRAAVNLIQNELDKTYHMEIVFLPQDTPGLKEAIMMRVKIDDRAARFLMEKQGFVVVPVPDSAF